VLPCCGMGTLQRTIWDGHPVSLGTGFELRKRKGARELHAVCRLESHLLGWQLFLETEGLPVSFASLPIAS
jgi:hypothetical protein